MAKRYLLVPPSWSDTKMKETQTKQQIEVDTISNANDIVNLYPKRQQNKAKLMLGYLNSVKLDANNRVVYSNGSTGSILYDLVRYYITDSGHFSAPKPIDADQFRHQYLTAIPSAAFGKGKAHEKKTLEWKTLP